MPFLTREEIESRLAQLRRDLDLAHATYSGAIQDCEWFLAQLDIEEIGQAEGPPATADKETAR
jgi:hypothetical protein